VENAFLHAARINLFGVRKTERDARKRGRDRRWDSRMVRAIPLTGGYLHIARSGATVVPRSRVRALGFNARSVAARFLPQRAASVLRIVGSSPKRA